MVLSEYNISSNFECDLHQNREKSVRKIVMVTEKKTTYIVQTMRLGVYSKTEVVITFDTVGRKLYIHL